MTAQVALITGAGGLAHHGPGIADRRRLHGHSPAGEMNPSSNAAQFQSARFFPCPSIATKESSTMKIKSVLAVVVAAATLATGSSIVVAQTYGAKSTAPMAAKSDIVDTAVGAGQFNTLAKALTAAGLIDTLKGPGPFTVFAPTDAAFAKVPADKLNALLADKAALTKVLTYHVVPGMVMAADVKTGAVKTVQGQALNMVASSSGVTVNNANVIKTDIAAKNGVIHVIDTVVLPN
jgi:uncharacterized surface protein with fasciclin (FAS1) repeats